MQTMLVHHLQAEYIFRRYTRRGSFSVKYFYKEHHLVMNYKLKQTFYSLIDRALYFLTV